MVMVMVNNKYLAAAIYYWSRNYDYDDEYISYDDDDYHDHHVKYLSEKATDHNGVEADDEGEGEEVAKYEETHLHSAQ